MRNAIIWLLVLLIFVGVLEFYGINKEDMKSFKCYTNEGQYFDIYYQE